ncbi:sialidase family protein [Rhodococcus sp. (in: high G+C Gram-positive bacteria)]|uniref:sialidase family protein n=1 Tax=Rhodococcus sp. TaxID=1831 RepID=UPI0033158EDF
MSKTVRGSSRTVTGLSRTLKGAGIGIALAATVTLAVPGAASAAWPLDFGSLGGSGSAALAGGITEVNVTNDPSRLNGQPVVAVNPNNPNNLVYISANHVPDPDNHGEVGEFQCYSAYSMDRGKSWTKTEFPNGDRPFCGDPNVAVDSTGTFFTAFNRLGCPGTDDLSGACPQGAGRVGVARSVDGGKTWSAPVDTTVFRATTPRLRIDSATDDVYVVGGPSGPSPHQVAVSSDNGLRWGPMAALPNQAFGNQIAVHDGVLATANALAVDNNVVVPGEVRFFTSTDGGATFASHAVTDSNGAPARLPNGVAFPDNVGKTATDPIPWVTADPTAHGRFAVMLPDGNNFAVYVTADSGVTWAGPTTIPAAGAAKPWIEYGPDGQLGVMWRTLGNDTVNVYATVSFNGGTTFGPAVQINQAAQPFGFHYSSSGGDEFSRILFAGNDVYVTWGDGRTGGELDGIVARAPLSMFQR